MHTRNSIQSKTHNDHTHTHTHTHTYIHGQITAGQKVNNGWCCNSSVNWSQAAQNWISIGHIFNLTAIALLCMSAFKHSFSLYRTGMNNNELYCSLKMTKTEENKGLMLQVHAQSRNKHPRQSRHQQRFVCIYIHGVHDRMWVRIGRISRPDYARHQYSTSTWRASGCILPRFGAYRHQITASNMHSTVTTVLFWQDTHGLAPVALASCPATHLYKVARYEHQSHTVCIVKHLPPA